MFFVVLLCTWDVFVHVFGSGIKISLSKVFFFWGGGDFTVKNGKMNKKKRDGG